VTQRGALARVEQLAVRDRRQRVGDVRILFDCRPMDPAKASPESSTAVEPFGEAGTFLGVTSMWVRTPFATYRKAICRRTIERGRRELDALKRERAFFLDALNHGAAQGRRTGLTGLRLLTDAKIPTGSVLWPLYAAPFGLTFQESAEVADWLRSSDVNVIAAIKSLARLLLAVHAQGYSLGICHPECFTYAAWWDRLDSSAVPRLGLFRAPGATRFGETYALMPQAEASDRYPRLHIDPVPPSMRSRKVAEPRVDAAGFAMFILDLLAIRSVEAASWVPLPTRFWTTATGCFGIRRLLAQSRSECAGMTPRSGSFSTMSRRTRRSISSSLPSPCKKLSHAKRTHPARR
jgi:hypothetical protein